MPTILGQMGLQSYTDHHLAAKAEKAAIAVKMSVFENKAAKAVKSYHIHHMVPIGTY